MRKVLLSAMVAAGLLGGCGERNGGGTATEPGPGVGSASVAAMSVPGGPAPAATPGAAPARIERVVDGDTLEVRLGSTTERVRLIGIDTPESVKQGSPVECFGVEASNRLTELLPAGTEVELVRDAELRDAYDRLLAYVFRRTDDLFVNLTMAADGYADVLTIPPNVTFADDFRAAVAAARRERLGLWRACPDPDALFS